MNVDFHRLLFSYKIVPGVIFSLHNVRGHGDEWIHTRTQEYRVFSSTLITVGSGLTASLKALLPLIYLKNDIFKKRYEFL